jgi:hypothetical protein
MSSTRRRESRKVRVEAGGDRVAASSSQPRTFHTARPSIYLDQWVWIRLARANVGRPDQPNDVAVLAAVHAAAARGVAFPLSATHYFETLSVTDPRQRRDLAAVMGPISRFLNLRAPGQLVRHQLLTVFHELYGRPAFRPSPATVLDLGVGWAMLGERVPLKIMTRGREREATDDEVPGRREMLRALGQLGEMQSLAGPADDEIPRLRALGYRPEVSRASTASRIAFETDFEQRLRGVKVDRDELRVWIMARELSHEHLDTFNDILAEYRLNFDHMFQFDPLVSGSARTAIMRMSDLVPTMRVAADMKLEIFRNPQRHWTVNMMHDIDALSHAVPYCHVVTADKDAADLLARSGAQSRYKTRVVTKLGDLPAAIAQLPRTSVAEQNPSGWDHIGPPSPFCSDDSDIPGWMRANSAERGE